MRKTITILKTSLMEIFAEKEILLIWSLAEGIGLISVMVAWLASDQAVIGGYTKSELVSYYFIIYLFTQIIGWWVFWDVREAIMSGKLSNYLLKPFSFIRYLFIHEFSYKVINMVTNIVVGIIIMIAIKDYLVISIDPATILKLIPAILIGIGINFLTHFSFACVTFFWTESHFMADFHWIASMVLSGSMIPLSLFPKVLEKIIYLNPFRFTFSLPAELLFGKITGQEYISGLLVGSFWVLFFGFLSLIMWKVGLRKYSSFGS
ncbi:ABC-2 family transporter protein [Candidatus Dojkabacteria bacterium]|nr:ABC-2 family transporter protein [Candidatus Dojkabacteria bacterium]